MVRNESVRFGRHIDIEVSYKILWLEVPKLVPILHFQLAFKRGCLEAVLSKNTLSPLGVKCMRASLPLTASSIRITELFHTPSAISTYFIE
jgi:hypothetical protein